MNFNRVDHIRTAKVVLTEARRVRIHGHVSKDNFFWLLKIAANTRRRAAAAPVGPSIHERCKPAAVPAALVQGDLFGGAL